MLKKAYSQDERAAVHQKLIEAALHLFTAHGYQKTTLTRLCQAAGISKTFFYTFFTCKEELMTEALYAQQLQIIQYARSLMASAPDWKSAMSQFLHRCCYGNQNGVMILSMEDEKEFHAHLSPAAFLQFRQRQVQFFHALLQIFTIPATKKEVTLIGNLFLSAAIMQKSIPYDAPFLFQEAAHEMTAFHIQSIIHLLETIRDRSNT